MSSMLNRQLATIRRIVRTETMSNFPSLIHLAELLNEARVEANANPATENQMGVYGDISDALQGTLELLTPESDKAYQALLDGATVLEALKVR